MELYLKKEMKTKRLNKHWQYCVGSGHATLALRADYLEQLKQVHEELGIERVRFHGIFNDDMQVFMKYSDLMPLPGAEQLTQLSFRKIGMVYDNILACGMKPYVELSFMPKHLASSDAKCGFYYGGCIAPPRDDAEWADFIKKFVSYLIDRYGAEEVECWPFEVWNEPDVFVFWAGTKEQYFHLYEVTARAVKEVDDKIRVGGPAASGSKWIGSFMAFCKERQIPVDFISSHQYAGDPIGGVEASEDLEAEGNPQAELPDAKAMEHLFDGLENGSVLDGVRRLMPDKSELMDIAGDGFRQNAAIVKKQAEGLPLYYSEWNENAIFSAYTNDTRKVAAYIVKAALDTEKIIDGSSIWCFSDIFEEFSEFPQEFHGGFGLMTHSGVPKSQYYALKMLAELEDGRLELGEGATDEEIGAAAFTGNGKLQILLFRQKMKNLDMPKEKAKVRVELDQEPQSVFQERIDEEHGNPLKVWEEWGSPEDLKPGDKKTLISRTKVEKEAVVYRYEEGRLVLEAELGVNDIYLFTVCL
ncbi:GH39 family glycosyl hydrolase [Schaedlerella arabinosiphila]|nr:hypothetical protein [Schaedlerella arabinosiphila]